MQSEREALVQRTFTGLRRRVEAMGTSLQEVDLRWGVTAEESAAGEAIEICLDEIDACRPLFIAIIGSRYGWVDPNAQAKLRGRYPHLLPYADRSITELEIRHAVLNAPPHLPAAQGFFYARGDVAQDFRSAQGDVARLLREIDERKLPLRRYEDPVQLAELVEADLEPLLRAALGEETLPAARRAQRAFSAYLAAPGFHRQRELRRLRRRLWLSRRIVVEGGVGSGKSTLLLALHRTDSDRGRHMALAPAAGRWHAAIESLVPTDPEPKTPELWHAMLEEIVQSQPGLTTIDGIGDAVGAVAGSGLEWVPRVRPRGALIVSTADPEVAASLAQAGFLRFALRPLSDRDLAAVIRQSLGIFGKVLSPELMATVVANIPERTPAYARTFVELLRQFGWHERIGQEVDRLLALRSTQELFGSALARLDALDGLPTGYVGRVLRLMTAARTGLKEAEILQLTGVDGRPAPMRWWSPIRATLAPFMFDRGGVLAIEAKALSAAVAARYCADRANLQAERTLLADYFLQRHTEARSIDELLFLLPAAGRWALARRLLRDKDWLCAAADRAPLELEVFANEVAQAEPEYADDVFKDLADIAATSPRPASAEPVISLLLRCGQARRAAWACETALANLADVDGGATGQDTSTLQLLLADTLTRSGDAKRALSVLARIDTWCSSAQSVARRSQILERGGLIALRLGDDDLAQRLFATASRCALEAKSSARRLMRLQLHEVEAKLAAGSHKSVLRDAAVLERRLRRAEDLQGIAIVLSLRAAALRQLGHWRQALRPLTEEERTWRLLRDDSGLARCLVNQALCHIDGDDFDRADDLLDQAAETASHDADPALFIDIRRRQIALLERLGLGSSQRAQHLARDVGFGRPETP